MTHRKWIKFGLCCLALAATVLAFGFRSNLAIAYHRRAMLHAVAKMYDIGPSGNQMPWIESYERHRDALVEYGYLVRREFPLVVKPPKTSLLWKKLCVEFPEMTATTPQCLDVRMQTTQWGGAENKLIVWDRPSRIAAWEAAIRKYDNPSELFSTQTAPSAQE